MLMEERRQLILNEINVKNIVYVKDLAKRYSVTMETIRKDLEDIINENSDIRKVYGGALKSSSNIVDESYNLRNELFSNEKSILAEKGANLINDGDSIFLDAGTTVSKIIPHLKSKQNLKIVTVSISVINEFINFFSGIDHTHSIFLVGGEVKPNLLSTSGVKVASDLENYFFDKAFLTLDGISLENGITSHNHDEALVTKTALKQSLENIFLITDEKFDTSKFYKVCNLNQVNSLISVNTENSFLKNLVKNFNINLYLCVIIFLLNNGGKLYEKNTVYT